MENSQTQTEKPEGISLIQTSIKTDGEYNATPTVSQIGSFSKLINLEMFTNKSKITLTNGIIRGALLIQNVTELKKMLMNSYEHVTPHYFYFCFGLLILMMTFQLGIFSLLGLIKVTTDKLYLSKINSAVLILSGLTFLIDMVYKILSQEGFSKVTSG